MWAFVQSGRCIEPSLEEREGEDMHFAKTAGGGLAKLSFHSSKPSTSHFCGVGLIAFIDQSHTSTSPSPSSRSERASPKGADGFKRRYSSGVFSLHRRSQVIVLSPKKPTGRPFTTASQSGALHGQVASAARYFAAVRAMQRCHCTQ